MAHTETSNANKRARSLVDDPEKENDAPDTNISDGKKRRIDTEAWRSSKSAPLSSPPAPRGPDPYTTFSTPTKDLIQLRFQMERDKGVYRIVKVPITYTFAHLHTLVQYLFGWSGRLSHRTRVYTNVEIFTSPAAQQYWCIKKKGQAPQYPDKWARDHERLSDDLQQVAREWFERENREAAIYHVVGMGKNKGGRGYFEDYSYHYKVEDPELALSDVWNVDEEKNLSKGEMGNEAIGLIYDYEVGCPWSVDITVDGGFYHAENPTDDIFVMAAKGAPPVESKHRWAPWHPRGCDKSVSDLLYLSRTFKEFCQKKIGSRVDVEEQTVYVIKTDDMTDEQVKEKQERLGKQATTTRKSHAKLERERQKQIREAKKREREERLAQEYESDSY